MRIDIDGSAVTTTASQDEALAWLASQRSADMTRERDAADPPAEGEVRAPVPCSPAEYLLFILESALASYEGQHARVAVETAVRADLLDPAKVAAAKASL